MRILLFYTRKAHAFANAAEELEEKEQWGKAMQAHFRAAGMLWCNSTALLLSFITGKKNISFY